MKKQNIKKTEFVSYGVQVKRNLLLIIPALLIFTTATTSLAVNLNGSGASFPKSIYALWFMLFERENGNVEIDYVAKGSGSGVNDFIAHNVDFAASDAAMNDEEIAKVKEGVQLLPMTASEVVIPYNLDGIDNLKLSREVYPLIFLGKIKKWNDPRIAAANPNVTLPDLAITVVTRVDSSGTTYIFTKHLSTISSEFDQQVGTSKKPNWPAELNKLDAPLNLGLSSAVKRTPGAIGYIDLGTAEASGLKKALVENKSGSYIVPSVESGKAALANIDIPDNMIAWVSDPDGQDSYPITNLTWMAFYKKYETPEKAELLREMVRFCIEDGQKISQKFGFIPLPENVSQKVLSAAENIQ